MIKHEAGQVIYLSHPRTASRATEKAFESVGFEWVHNASRHQRLWDSDWWCYLSPEERAEWTVTTTVRNPFDAVVSWYLNRPYRFNEFCPEWLNQLLDHERRYLHDERLWKLHGHRADHVFHFEQIPECFDVLSEWGIQVPEVERVGVTERREGRDYQEFYDDEMQRVVREQFAADFEEYGYGWERREQAA